MTVKAAKVGYQELIEFIQTQTGFSYYKSRTILKELSKVLAESVSSGIAIECTGLFKVDFTITGTINSNADYLDIHSQARQVSERLPYTKMDITNVIRLYYSKIKSDVESGYQVNVKSIGYLTPKESEDGSVYIETRLSPQLKKPEQSEFVVLDSRGDFMIANVSHDKIRLSIIPDDNLRIPHRVVPSNESRKTEYIEFK